MHHVSPPLNFEFPYTEKRYKNKNGQQIIEKRFAKHEHLEKFPWLVFSLKLSGFFCLPCALIMNKKTVRNSIENFKIGKLVSEPLKNFTKLTEKNGKFYTHQSNLYHIESVNILKEFKTRYVNTSLNIVNILNNSRRKQADENKKWICLVIDTILTLGRQGLALRGHRDSGKFEDSKENANGGNFRSLLQFRKRGGDKTFDNEEIINKYLSPTIQNEIIRIIQELCIAKILEKVFKK